MRFRRPSGFCQHVLEAPLVLLEVCICLCRQMDEELICMQVELCMHGSACTMSEKWLLIVYLASPSLCLEMRVLIRRGDEFGG